MPSSLALGWLQLTSSDHPDENLRHILSGLKTFEGSSLQAVILPENCLYHRLEKGPLTFALSGAEDPLLAPLKSWCQNHQMALGLGGVCTASSSGRPTNSFWWITPQGEALNAYSKLHLFDVDVEGEPRVRESESFSAGASATVLKLGEVSLGLSICYDLRFPELYQSLRKAGAQVLLVPSSFLPRTGRAHWLPLLRARAIETQCYVVAPAQGGIHQGSAGSKRATWGQSVLLSPWGEVLQALPSLDDKNGAGGVLAAQGVLDLNQLQTVRQQIPLFQHKKSPSCFENVRSLSIPAHIET